MDEQRSNQRPNNPRRRHRTRMQVIKEDYLPVFVVIIGLILIFTFIIGSIVRGVQRKRYQRDTAQQQLIASQQSQAALEKEAADLLAEAAVLAADYDYDGAIAVLDRFSGDMYAFKDLSAKYAEYATAADSLVLWEDPNAIYNLSIHPLIADPERAFAGTNFYAENYITVEEFTKLLPQLYENGYMLIKHSDIVIKDGKMDLKLPKGKKPLIITETQVNYNTSLIDKGFASKLILDENGKLTNQMIDKDGNTVTGAFDIVPILNAFIETHPDFSYRGAKAILALTGYDGLFGYRTSSKNPEENREVEKEAVKKIIAAVKAEGYELACYTYSNEAYGTNSTDFIRSEMELWKSEVTPLLGEVNLFIFALKSDIAEKGVSYSGEKFEILKSYGFTDYLGFADDGKPWFNSYDNYTRMGRIMITGLNLQEHPD